jgi:putative transposase
MIEALFRSLKHRWLFMNSLTTFESVKESVSKYLNDLNYRIPHHALKGALPIEIYTGKDSNTLNSLFL